MRGIPYPDVMPEPEEIARYFKIQECQINAIHMGMHEIANSISEHICQKKLIKELELKISQYDLALKNVQRALLKEKKTVRLRIWENIWTENEKIIS